jgi:alkylated DNA repair dioxygenase AlkB
MLDLFDALEPEKVKIDLPDSDLWLFKHFLNHDESQKYFNELLTETPWKQEKVFVWGKWHDQPRLIAWYGDPEATYSYSKSSLVPLPWTPLLQNLKSRVEAVSETRFNSVLLNLYRDQKDGMGWHSDDEPALGPTPFIASLNLGESRTFQLRHKLNPQLPIKSLVLTSGSLLLMHGKTQTFWQHAIKKENKNVASRINLTFRFIYK